MPAARRNIPNPPKKRIAVTAGHAPSLVRFRGRLLEDMVALGHTVTALAPPAETETDTAAVLQGMGVDFRAVPLARQGLNPLADLRTLSALTALFRALKPDLVFNYTIKPVIWGGLAAQKAGVAETYSLVSGLGRAFAPRGIWGSALQGLVAGLYRRALARNKMVFFQNPDDEALFRERGLLRPDTPTLVVPGSGVDLDEFPAVAPADPPPVFLCLARLLKDKGVLEYAEAARRLRQVFPQVRFLLAGPQETGPGAVPKSEIEQWEREEGVEYLGQVDDVRPLLAQCMAFVLPSYYGEGLPRSSLEALATGRAVVTTDHPGCRLAVDHERTGLLVRPRDPDHLAEALTRLVSQPDLARSMGLAARLEAEERFDVRLVNQMLLGAMGLGDKA